MSLRNKVLSIMEGVITVQVKFNESDSKKYTFLALESEGYKVDEAAVVEAKGGGHRMVKVVRVDEECDVDPDGDLEYKFLLARVDEKAHDAKYEQVEEALKFFKAQQRKRNREAARQEMLNENGLNTDKGIALLSFGGGENGGQEAEIIEAD